MKNYPLLFSPQRKVIYTCLVTTLFVLAFALLWWNHYLGITNDGWHFFHAQQILNGKIPYRDFYLFIPPLHPLCIALEIRLFGEQLLVPQIIGLLERIVLFVVLGIWLCRHFPARYVLIGLAVGSAAYLADTSETLSSLHHEAIFWPTLATLCLCNALQNTSRRWLWCFAAGLLSGLAFMGKQTSGMGIALAIPFFCCLAFYKEGWRALGKILSVYALGLALPVGAIVWWLASQGAFSAYIDQIFLRGPASKGSLAKVLLRPLTMTLEDVYMRRNAALALLVVGVVGWAIRRGRLRKSADNNFAPESVELRPAQASLSETPSALPDDRATAEPLPEPRRNHKRSLLLITAGIFLALILGVLLSTYQTPFWSSYWIQIAWQVPGYIAEVGMLVLFLAYGWHWWHGSLDARQWQLWAFCFTTFAVIVTLSFSWVVFVSMLVPALPFLVAYALSRVPGRFLRRAIFTACLAVIVMMVWSKLSRPYIWAGFSEPPVHYATENSVLPELQGVKLSPASKAQVEKIVHIIEENSSANDAVFVHPHIPIFYTLAHRRPPTFAAVHFFDVCPDYVARQDARTLLANPPAVIVDLEFSEEQLRDNETLFRNGQRSGQREIIAAIQQLTADYTLLESYELAPRKNLLKVWVKKNPAELATQNVAQTSPE